MAQDIRNRVIPARNHMCHGFLHFGLSINARHQGETEKALLHAQEGLRRIRMCQYEVAESLGIILEVIVLRDLNRDDEAKSILESYLTAPYEDRHYYFAAATTFELADIYLSCGETDKARRYLKKGTERLSPQYMPRSFFRKEDFSNDLINALRERPVHLLDKTGPGKADVRIQTLGEFCICFGKRSFFENQWRGKRTKQLLKKIIAYAPKPVSLSKLADDFWPDTDGDRAMGNLKVTLSRLRNMGWKNNCEKARWILVKDRRVSLEKCLCYVDAIHFEETLAKAMASPGDLTGLMSALDIYRGDFFGGDLNDTVVINRRDKPS